MAKTFKTFKELKEHWVNKEPQYDSRTTTTSTDNRSNTLLYPNKPSNN